MLILSLVPRPFEGEGRERGYADTVLICNGSFILACRGFEFSISEIIVYFILSCPILPLQAIHSSTDKSLIVLARIIALGVVIIVLLLHTARAV
jgi:energy-converting hydrogenase Eha subunit A